MSIVPATQVAPRTRAALRLVQLRRLLDGVGAKGVARCKPHTWTAGLSDDGPYVLAFLVLEESGEAHVCGKQFGRVSDGQSNLSWKGFTSAIHCFSHTIHCHVGGEWNLNEL